MVQKSLLTLALYTNQQKTPFFKLILKTSQTMDQIIVSMEEECLVTMDLGFTKHFAKNKKEKEIR